MSLEYKVPRILWENFESVLLAQSKRYVCELARYLNVPEKELLKKALPSSDTLKVIIQDSQSDTLQCKAYTQNGKITAFCRKPVAYGCEFCTFHRDKRMIIIEELNTESITMQRIKDVNILPPTWISGDTLYNSSGDIIGKINKKNHKIKIFNKST
jgi:hypothetical protein